jgi:hypothetical protein
MRQSNQVGSWLIIIAAMVVAILYGWIASIGALYFVAIAVAPIGLASTLFLKIETLIWLLLISATVAGGSLQYFAHISVATWIPILVAIVLYMSLFMRVVGMPRNAIPPTPPLVLLALAFGVVAVVSTVWSGASASEWGYGFRFYFAIGALVLALSLAELSPDLLRRLWSALLIISYVQLPVVIYQYIFVERKRAATNAEGLAFDAVVGTMGGSQEAGGQSAALGFFVVSCLILVMALWKRGLIGNGKMLRFSALVLCVIFIAEVKFYALLMPLAVALVFRTELLSRIKILFVGLSVVVLIAVGMPPIYSKIHYQNTWEHHPEGIVDFYVFMFSRLDSKIISPQGEMGRITQLAFWWKQTPFAEKPKEFLIGHGMGSTSFSRFGLGSVTKKYFPMLFATTSAAVLLWEVGIVGLLLAISGFLWAAVLSFRLSTISTIPVFYRTALDAGAVICIIAIPTLFYKNIALQSQAVQFLTLLVVGQICYWQTGTYRTRFNDFKAEGSLRHEIRV